MHIMTTSVHHWLLNPIFDIHFRLHARIFQSRQLFHWQCIHICPVHNLVLLVLPKIRVSSMCKTKHNCSERECNTSLALNQRSLPSSKSRLKRGKSPTSTTQTLPPHSSKPPQVPSHQFPPSPQNPPTSLLPISTAKHNSLPISNNQANPPTAPIQKTLSFK